MKRKIIHTRNFTKDSDVLIRKRHLLLEDLNAFEREVAENPKIGELISGTGGVYKARVKSASRGKSGGFRICYYYFVIKERIYLLVIYPKNEKENLTIQEKAILKEFVTFLKGATNE